jgi:hypothetical protein
MSTPVGSASWGGGEDPTLHGNYEGEYRIIYEGLWQNECYPVEAYITALNITT